MTTGTRSLIGLLTLLAVILGVSYLFTHDSRTIVLKEDGWHPRTLTIQAGETVTFKNERGKYFWPASDFHPTHTVYPAFDAKQPVAPDDSWSFVFTEPGIYKYHDHLAAFYFGIIKVTDGAGRLVDDCMNRGGTFECWQNQVFIALAERGVDAAYGTITDLYETVPEFAASCHSIAHNVGLASYQFYREDPDFIYSPKAIACAAGFYHGFMEGYLGATTDSEGAAQVCKTIGERIGKEAPDAGLQCYHGIGHGAIETTVASTGVFKSIDDVVNAAVALCDRAAPESDPHYRCVSGLYNGIANFYINGEYGLSLETSDPLALCSRQIEENKDSCYGNMNSLYMWHADNDLKKAASRLLAIPDEKYRASAIEYAARIAAVSYLSGEHTGARITADCGALPETYADDCIRGIVGGILEHGSPGTEYTEALAFCAEASGGSFTNTCYEKTIGNLPGWYSKEKSAAICAHEVPAHLQHYCEK